VLDVSAAAGVPLACRSGLVFCIFVGGSIVVMMLVS